MKAALKGWLLAGLMFGLSSGVAISQVSTPKIVGQKGLNLKPGGASHTVSLAI